MKKIIAQHPEIPENQKMSLFRLEQLEGSEHPIEVTIRERIKKSPVLRKMIDKTNEIIDERATIKNAEFLHSVMCQVGMPRSQTDARVFERTTGGVFIRLEAGALYLGGKMVEQPLPYGVKPRLAMIHITTEAIRTKNPEVEVGNSIRDFLLKLDLDDNGRSHKAFNSQIQALAASHLTIGANFGGKDVTVKTNPIDKFEAWISKDNKQAAMWSGTMRLSQEFFEAIQEFAVPLDSRALSALSHTALGLDIYTWLAYRLCQISKPEGVHVSWTALHNQFGQEYSNLKDFKKEFKKTLRQVHAVYLDAKFELDDRAGGMILKPSLSPIPKKYYQVLPLDRL